MKKLTKEEFLNMKIGDVLEFTPQNEDLVCIKGANNYLFNVEDLGIELITEKPNIEEVILRAIYKNFPGYKREEWTVSRRYWLMGKVMCEIKGKASPNMILRSIDFFIEKKLWTTENLEEG